MPRKAAALDLDFTLHDDDKKMSESMDQHTNDETRVNEVEDSTTATVPEAQEAKTDTAIPTVDTATEGEADTATAQQASEEAQEQEDNTAAEEGMATSEPTQEPELVDPAAEPESVEAGDPEPQSDAVAEEAEPAAEDLDNADLEPQDLAAEVQEEVAAAEDDAPTTLASSEPGATDEAVIEEPSQAQDDESPVDQAEADADVEEAPRPRSPAVNRKASLRTEALIQAAARAVMAKIERRNSGALEEVEEDEFDNSMLSTASHDDDAESPYETQRGSPKPRHAPSHSLSSDDAGNSSSPPDADDDDLFSDRSARSSVCSVDALPTLPSDEDAKTPQAKDKPSRRDSYTTTSSTTTAGAHHHTHSPRTISGFSTLSALSHYSDDADPTHLDDKSFTPTARLPFRTPSEIRAMHLSSPTPSVFNGSSPLRSGRKRGNNGGGSQSGGSLSRIGSPTPTTTLSTTQYSPKGRTPPRFKPPRPDPAPLVLLHVTLLPLRWAWGDIVSLSSTDGSSSECEGSSDPALRALRDAWRMLQDRVGDTVLERGVLLPHPQNDYEVLEERLLEALELPLRRRARILACGHYLGAANLEDEDGGEEDGEQTEWCGTCKGERRYEQLGAGRVFRVKVYASNGLMRAGAWEACWREMERVDVEVEPIVELAVQAELEKLGALQLEMEEERRREEEELERAIEMEAAAAVKAEMMRAETPLEHSRLEAMGSSRPTSRLEAMASRPASAMQLAAASSSLVRARTPTPAPRQSEPIDTSEDRRRRDEERFREIYGDEPAQQQPQPESHHPDEPLYPPPVQNQSLTLATPPQRLLTDGTNHPSYPDHHAHPQPQPYPNHPNHTDPHHHPSSQHQNQYNNPAPQQPPQAPTSSLPPHPSATDLLTEALRVLLRDPKNVAILVLCAFLVVLIKQHQPGGGGALVPVAAPVVNMPVVPAVEPAVREVRSLGAGVEVTVAEKEVVAQIPKPVMEVAAPEVVLETPVADELVDELVEEAVAEVLVEEVEVETEVQGEQEVSPAVEVAEEPEVQSEVEEIALSPEVISLGDICLPRGLEYPITMLDEMPIMGETEEDLAATEEVEEALPADVRETEATEVDNREDTADDALPEEASSEASPPDESTDSLCAPAAETDEATPTTTASTTSLFIPGPLVTERKTVRVFETVTETVRVSVVTETETVSTVVTAVPQTVEETVYETETVRITVSVPVEEQMERRKKGGKGEEGCKGWF